MKLYVNGRLEEVTKQELKVLEKFFIVEEKEKIMETNSLANPNKIVLKHSFKYTELVKVKEVAKYLSEHPPTKSNKRFITEIDMDKELAYTKYENSIYCDTYTKKTKLRKYKESNGNYFHHIPVEEYGENYNPEGLFYWTFNETLNINTKSKTVKEDKEFLENLIMRFGLNYTSTEKVKVYTLKKKL